MSHYQPAGVLLLLCKAFAGRNGLATKGQRPVAFT